MHRQEGDVEAAKQKPEGDSPKPFGKQFAVYKREKIVGSGDYGKDGSSDENRVEMRHDEVRIVRLKIEGRHGNHHSGQATNHKRGQAARDVEHRDRWAKPADVHGRNKAK